MTPDALAACVNDAIDQWQASKCRIEREDIKRELDALRDEMRRMVLIPRSWHLSRAPFSPRCLADRGRHKDRWRMTGWPHSLTARREFIRDHDKCAVALLAHLHEVPVHKAEAWASSRRLWFLVSTEFPSWFCPRDCTLVALVPLGGPALPGFLPP